MDAENTLEKDTKNAKIMLGVFGVLTLLFVCLGSAVVGVAASGSESDGVTAAMAMTGPACCSLGGLAAALLAMVALPTNKTGQMVLPIVAGLLAGLFGGAGMFFFIAVIFPAL